MAHWSGTNIFVFKKLTSETGKYNFETVNITEERVRELTITSDTVLTVGAVYNQATHTALTQFAEYTCVPLRIYGTNVL